ncbi:hypothetical protein [Streptomyces sp. 142MFCol3.1]|nr:hypothetical protein [Streptomyces sp. 142MFCol3.1]
MSVRPVRSPGRAHRVGAVAGAGDEGRCGVRPLLDGPTHTMM